MVHTLFSLCADRIIEENNEERWTGLPVALAKVLRRRTAARNVWLKKNSRFLVHANQFLRFLVWKEVDRVDGPETCRMLLDGSCLTPLDKFRLVCVFCSSEEDVLHFWTKLHEDQQRELDSADPIVNYWKATCTNQRWLANSFSVPAFYVAAQNNFVEALDFFWRMIPVDELAFRRVRAFQAAAFGGNADVVEYIWRHNGGDEDRRGLLKNILESTDLSLRLFDCLIDSDRFDVLKLMFNEAAVELRRVMLRRDNFRVFRSAIEEDRVELVEYLLQKASFLQMSAALLDMDEKWPLKFCIRFQRNRLLHVLRQYAATVEDSFEIC